MFFLNFFLEILLNKKPVLAFELYEKITVHGKKHRNLTWKYLYNVLYQYPVSRRYKCRKQTAGK
jgi:hypothetical protein